MIAYATQSDGSGLVIIVCCFGIACASVTWLRDRMNR